jgi:hypothetical protein
MVPGVLDCGMMKNDTELRLELTFHPEASEAEKTQITRMLATAIADIMDDEMRFTDLGELLQDYTVKMHRA